MWGKLLACLSHEQASSLLHIAAAPGGTFTNGTLQTCRHTVAQRAESFDRQLDNIVRFQPAADGFGRQFEDAAGPDSARADDVAGPQQDVAAGMRENLWPGPMHGAAVAARKLTAIDLGRHF